VDQPDLQKLHLALLRLPLGPKATAKILEAVPEDGLPDFKSGRLVALAKDYWLQVRWPKDPAPAVLHRQLLALAAHAKKLAEGLEGLPIITNPSWLKAGFEPHQWCAVDIEKQGGWHHAPPSERIQELLDLQSFLEWRATQVEVEPVGPKTPPVRTSTPWNDEFNLAWQLMAQCQHHGLDQEHALPITKAILAWAAPRGSKPKYFGRKTWETVKALTSEHKCLVAESQPN